jgi:hypothetical protein
VSEVDIEYSCRSVCYVAHLLWPYDMSYDAIRWKLYKEDFEIAAAKLTQTLRFVAIIIAWMCEIHKTYVDLILYACWILLHYIL